MISEKLVKYSPWVLHFNTGACNGCDIEVLATVAPNYDPERFGVRLIPNPRHADILLITGALNKKSSERLRRLYSQMPSPKYVIACGTCAITGGVFAGSYSTYSRADKVVPVDIAIPGCPPRPESILFGIKTLLGKIGGRDGRPR